MNVYIEIKLISLKKSGSAKKSITWNEERFTVDMNIITPEDNKDTVIKVMKILSIPEPYKKSKGVQLASSTTKKPKQNLEEEKEVVQPKKEKKEVPIKVRFRYNFLESG